MEHIFEGVEDTIDVKEYLLKLIFVIFISRTNFLVYKKYIFLKKSVLKLFNQSNIKKKLKIISK